MPRAVRAARQLRAASMVQRRRASRARRVLRAGRLLLAVLLAVLPARQLGAQAPSARDSALLIRFVDVGQGDAVLITLASQSVLVDAGRGDDFIQVLAEYGVDSLVAAIASHNHDDHIGGMDAVLADFPVRQYFANGRPPANRNAQSVEEWLQILEVARPPPPWQPIALADARITVFPTTLGARASENNSSLGVLIERGGFRALLTGDSEIEELNGWLAAGVIPRVTVLKAAHHGARDAVTPGWLDRTRPEVVVISLGAGNTYGHPSPAAMRYYAAGGRRIYRTDTQGTITVVVDAAGRYRVETTGPTARDQ